MNLLACGLLTRTPENAVWYRAVLNAFFPTAFSHAHTKLAPSRFNAGRGLPAADQFSALYFAADPLTAQFEVGALLGSFGPGTYVPNPRLAHTMLNVQVILQDVVDVTLPSAQTSLGTSAQELTGDWQGYETRSTRTSVSAPTGIAPTQELGHAIYGTGVEGFRAISARLPFNRTLVVFPDNMRKGSSLTYSDAITGNVEHEIRP